MSSAALLPLSMLVYDSNAKEVQAWYVHIDIDSTGNDLIA
jgi:hypothetical protein